MDGRVAVRQMETVPDRTRWLRLFRLPNLPTAPGDAAAGAALAASAAGLDVRPAAVVAASAAALLLYMYGLVDNDIAGLERDRTAAPERPLPSGAISLRAAKAARAVCWGLAFLAGAAAGLPPAWWLGAGILLVAVLAYNRLKGVWLMGLCRALSVVCGAAAVMPRAASWREWPIAVLVVMALGWTAYVAAITKLSEGEEKVSEGLGNRRYLLGLAAFVALPACAFLPDPRMAILPLAGCLFAFWGWCVAVAPLWRAHSPEERRAAVGAAVGAILYMQVGFILCRPVPVFLGVACVVWIAARVVRRLAPGISGS